MNIKITTLVLSLIFCLEALAQPVDRLVYSFVSEKRYSLIQELDGEVFVPAEYQKAREDVTKVRVGQMKVTIYPQKIAIKGVKELGDGTFHVLSKSPNRVGYVYELMDQSGQAARFKVVTDQHKYVNLLYFYSKKLGEHTFFLAEKDEKEVAEEQSFYTIKHQFFVRSYRNLIEKTVQPYEMAVKGGNKQKIKKGQNMSFAFEKESVTLPQGTFKLKGAKTFAYKLPGHPSVRSMIELKLKGKVKKAAIYLNFKQQIELIEVGNTRYFLKA